MFATPKVIRPSASVSIGVVGPRGATLIGFPRPPLVTDGNEGDYFIDLTAGDVRLYGPKTSGIWPSSYLSLVGPQGSPGPQILSGGGAPTQTIGNSGDYYIDTAASIFYGPKTTGQWPTPGVNLIGNQGNPGPANTLSIGTVTALAPGATPTVTITGTAPNQSIAFGLPQGPPGRDGTGAGTVVGPATPTAGHLASFSDGTGTNISDSGIDPTTLATKASPAFTGTPTTPTPAVADNSTKLATTAYADRAAANVTAGSPSAYNSQALPYTAAAADKGTTINPTGTGALTLPAATAVSGWFAWIKKRDDGGTATLTPASGAIDGLASIRAYKEEFLVYYDAAASTAAGTPVYRTQGRQRGWIDFGSFSVTSGTASVSITAGAGDADIRDIDIDVENYVPSAAGTLSVTIQQAGSAGTFTGEFLSASTTSVTAGAASSIAGLGPSSVPPRSASVAFKNIQSSVANGIRAVVSTIGNSGYFLEMRGAFSTAGAVSSISITPSTGTITSMLYNVRLYRP